MGDLRGSIAFFGTYRPPVPLDIYSRPADPAANSDNEPLLLTDGESYNHNGREIPAAALKELVAFLRKRDPKTRDASRGLVFVSERDNGLETLHVALYSDGEPTPRVLSLADIYGAGTFGGVRLEDSGCFGGGFQAGGRTVGHSIIYVSTKDPVKARRTPWTVVYKTNLADGKTERLTPPDQYDLSPAVSPSGKKVAVANFQFHRWNGEIEHLKTDIVIMNVDRQAQGGLERKVTIRNAGWPTWGSDNVIFFHRANTPDDTKKLDVYWGVFRYDIKAKKEERVTPEGIRAMTPAAISETSVAVATLIEKSPANVSAAPRKNVEQYRHIEIFDTTSPNSPLKITRGMADHYSPIVLDGGSRIGYHCCRTDKLMQDKKGNAVAPKKFDKLQTPASHKDVGLFRVTGVFPSISMDGKRLAFVDNEFKAVWVADKDGLRVIHKENGENKVFSTAWSNSKEKTILYICDGPAFTRAKTVEIKAIVKNEETGEWNKPNRLTKGEFNHAFPSSNHDGSKFVFRCTRDRTHGQSVRKQNHTNLYIMEDAEEGEWGEGTVTQLTDGPWVDTHCSWSPSGDWIVFSSSRDKDPDAQPGTLDAGYFSIYIVNAAERDPTNKTMPPPVRVVHSADTFIGHVNHPVFSHDMRSLIFTSDLAAVSVEPISMPIFIHSVRPYGDIFSVDLRDDKDIAKNENITEFHRLTHSRYEYSTPAWTKFATVDPNEQWNVLKTISDKGYVPTCPYLKNGAEGWQMAGHLTISKRCC
ncbi:hypothetical protein SEVIR_3G089900v4 [Setaria viridis]|uniref:Dipeptidylpeptidase IV N-terminal domain-containing protein n=1 Tax=Setaria viridis TaxID=4556 RepID=A0A4U6V721_SETVI|nr:uncharacterized protein LOC117847607 [Setaria viridis]TKW25030.1 hypothetical protein SEVIR_3G089900v2 [Setaria viridis]